MRDETEMIQKSKAMELFPPETLGFSYLMYFEDGNKLDLTVLSLDELDRYLAADKLVNVLLDKDSTEGVPQGGPLSPLLGTSC